MLALSLFVNFPLLTGMFLWCCLLQGVASPERRVELFAAYVEALRQVAAQRMTKAEAALRELLVKLNVGPESDWEEVRKLLLLLHGPGVASTPRREPTRLAGHQCHVTHTSHGALGCWVTGPVGANRWTGT